MPDKPFRKTQRNLNDYARYSNMAFQMIIIILAGTFGGIRLDKAVQFRFPVFTVALSFLSVILAIYVVIREILSKK